MKRRSSTKELPEPTFFVDRNLGRGFARVLQNAGLKVEALEDHFPDNASDTDWLSVVGERGWVVFTNDKRMGRDEREIDALMFSGVRAFLPGTRMKPEEFAELVVKGRHKLLLFLIRNEKKKSGPFFAKIKSRKSSSVKPPSIETWIDQKKWKEMRRKRKHP